MKALFVKLSKNILIGIILAIAIATLGETSVAYSAEQDLDLLISALINKRTEISAQIVEIKKQRADTNFFLRYKFNAKLEEYENYLKCINTDIDRYENINKEVENIPVIGIFYASDINYDPEDIDSLLHSFIDRLNQISTQIQKLERLKNDYPSNNKTKYTNINRKIKEYTDYLTSMQQNNEEEFIFYEVCDACGGTGEGKGLFDWGDCNKCKGRGKISQRLSAKTLFKYIKDHQ